MPRKTYGGEELVGILRDIEILSGKGEDEITEQIVELSRAYGRYGYRRFLPCYVDVGIE